MKPFDLKKALAGEKVMTKCGYQIDHLGSIYNIAAGTWHAWKGTMPGGSEILIKTNNAGEAFLFDGSSRIPEHDIVMVQIKREAWTNVYKSNGGFVFTSGCCYPTKEIAEKKVQDDPSYLKTILVHEWEE